MEPGFYVVRLPHRGMGSRLVIESRPFRIVEGMADITPEYAREYAERQADLFREVVQTEHPKDEVFVIERKA